jgi:alpha-L-rhamnosidase
MMGERQDLRQEPRGWDAPGYDATGWRAVRCRGRDSRPLVADPGPPIRVTQEVRPVVMTRYASGRQIIDFGQNLTGWVRIKIDGSPGTSIRVRHAEVLADDGVRLSA